ncbi:MAG: DUF748 domain-containing protein [Halioglobus sp.]
MNTLFANKWIRYTGIAYLVYLGIALLIITPLLNFLPHKFLQDNYDRELATKFVWLNPFALSLDVHEGQLYEPSEPTTTEPFVAFKTLSVNVSLASIWREGIVFDHLRLHELAAHAQRFPKGVFNFSDFLAGSAEGETVKAAENTANSSEEGGLIGVTVNNLDLQAAVIKVTDHDRAQPFSTQWQDLKINAVDFSTVLREGKPYRIELADEAGGTLLWEGSISVAQANSEGALTLTDIRLAPFWRFAEPWVQFELQQGKFNAAGNYRVQWSDDVHFQVNNGAASVDALSITPKSDAALPDTALELTSISLKGLAVDSTKTHAALDQIVVDGLAIDGFSEGSAVSLQTLLTPQLGDQPAESEPESADSASPWTASLASFEIQRSQVRWRSEFTNPPRLDITDINAQIDNVQWPLAGETALALGLLLNGSGTFNAEGEMALATGTGDVRYKAGAVQLPWFDPALPDEFRALLTGGEASASGSVSLADFAPQTAGVDAAINQFGMRQNDADQQFTGWDTLQLEALNLDFTKKSVRLTALTLDALQARVHIAKDGTLNTSNLWVATAEEAGDTIDEPTAAKNTDEDTHEDTHEDNGAAASPDEETPWQIEIPKIALKNAAIDFQDDSLPIEFRTLIGNMSGFIEGLNSTGGNAAKVDIKGSVDGYAPVSLAGTLNPLQNPPALDLKLTFDGVDLARVTPYSGTYAGYAIDRGLLDLDLAYTLQDNKLQGKNSAIIDQLKLGEGVNSDKAIDIPLKLGISLLTNANGVIDMKIPVSGSLDDPSFKLSSVIVSAFVNLITKAVTAPFSLLANLVSSDEDMQYVPFAPGDSVLPPKSGETLLKLTEALSQRPGLALAIVGRVHPTEDRIALQNKALNAALLSQGLTQTSIETRDAAWLAAITAHSSADTDAPEPPSTQEMLSTALESFPIDDSALLALAEARATAVKTFLLNDAALDPARAVIEKAALEDQSRDFNGAELLIEN